MNNEPKKILISGGWGYGNLGDDAILSTTIKLLKAQYPLAELVVMTYDCNETQKNLGDFQVKLIPSLHRLIAGDFSFRKFRVMAPDSFYKRSKLYALLQKVGAKIYDKFLFSLIENRILRKFVNIKNLMDKASIYDEFRSSDLFVLGGGGYLNDGWPDNVDAHLLELEMARQTKTKTLVIGQSIGPFRHIKIRSRVSDTLKKVDIVSIRDFDSEKEILSYGIKSVLIPDTALAELVEPKMKLGRIALILGGEGLKSNEIEIIAETLVRYVSIKPVKIVILVSRLWIPDFELADKMYLALRKKGIDVEFKIPATHIELQDELGKSNLLISQNLHGLILAWRAGVPCISLNAGRKFKAFMSQTNQMEYLIPVKEVTISNLFECVDSGYSDLILMSELHKSIADEVTVKFSDCLKALSRPLTENHAQN